MIIKQPTEQEIQKIKRIVFRTWKIKLAEESCGIYSKPSEFMMSSVNFGDHIEEILLEYRKLLEKLPEPKSLKKAKLKRGDFQKV